MAESVNLGGFIASFITFCFVFSTLFTLAFYYYQGAASTTLSNPMDENASDLLKTIGGILNLISFLSPFGILKLFIAVIMASTLDLYNLIDMLILRPIGWIVVMLEANWILSKIPTISGE